jgi:sigma54-dependent transcription regulator
VGYPTPYKGDEMVKIVVDVENRSFSIVELSKHSLDLDEIRSHIQKIIENSQTREDIYTELNFWQFELPEEVEEQIIVDVE